MKLLLASAIAAGAMLSTAPAMAQPINHHHGIIVHRHKICQWRHHRKVCFYR